MERRKPRARSCGAQSPDLRGWLRGALLAVLVAPTQSALEAGDPQAVRQGGEKAREVGNVMWRFDGNGRHPNIHPPTEWRRDRNILWRTPVEGGGYSSPIVVRGKVFVTAEMGSLLCLGLEDGKILWKKDLFSKDSKDIPAELSEKLKRGCGGDSKQSTPTPASNGELVFYINATGLCACYDLRGNQKWIRVIETADEEEHFSSSPVFADGRIVLSWGCLVALDARTGRTLWKAAESRPTHGTPVLAKVGGERVVITPSGEVVRLDDGEILCSGLFKSKFTTPLVEGTVVYLIDVRARALELPARAEKGMRLKELWKAQLVGPFMSSPVYRDGLIYTIASQKSRPLIIDAKTGELLTAARGAGGAAEAGTTEKGMKVDGLAASRFVYASPVASRQNVFFFDDGGNTAVFGPGRSYSLIRVNKLEEGIVGTPFFIDEKVIIRGARAVYCVAARK